MIDEHENTLEAEGDRGRIEISVRPAKNGMAYIATSAIEYWVTEDENGTIEGEDKVTVAEAVQHLIRPVPTNMENVDGHFSVYSETHGLRPLVWFEGEPGQRRAQSIKIV